MQKAPTQFYKTLEALIYYSTRDGFEHSNLGLSVSSSITVLTPLTKGKKHTLEHPYGQMSIRGPLASTINIVTNVNYAATGVIYDCSDTIKTSSVIYTSRV